jgi:hypothetical protein
MPLIDDKVALLDDVTILQMDVLAFRNKVLAGLLVLVDRLYRDATLVLVIAAEPDSAGDFRDDCRVLRPASLEQFGHSRQTAGDVAGLGALGRDTRQDVAGFHLGANVDRQNGVDRQHVAGVAATGQLQHLAVLALDHDGWTQVGSPTRRAPVDNDALGDTGGFVERFGDRLTFDQIFESDSTLKLCQNRPGVGIPLGDTLAALDHVTFVNVHARAVLDAVGCAFSAVRIDNGDDHITHHRNQITFAVSCDRPVPERDLAVEVRLDHRLLVDLRSATDMERAHRELRTRLANRLRRDDADRLAVIDGRAASQITAIALAADAVDQFASQGRADLDFLDTGPGDLIDMAFFHQGVTLDYHLVIRGITDVIAGRAAQDARS